MTSFRTGFFLAVRYIKRSGVWTSVLIVSIMTVTFLNLVFVTGILVGLIEGATKGYVEEYSGDVIISNSDDKQYIHNTYALLQALEKIPEIHSFSPRYVSYAIISADYAKSADPYGIKNQISASVVGINPSREDSVTGLSANVVEGSYFSLRGGENEILIGSDFLEQYSRGFDLSGILKNVTVGSKVRMRIGSVEKEFIVRGVLQTKVDEVVFRVFMHENALKNMIAEQSGNVNEIAIKIQENQSADTVVSILKKNGFESYGKVETSFESFGEFLTEIKDTFALLGNMIGGVSLVVASITVFIVIFINAITRKRQIGILKGIGVTERAIILSYVLQAVWYALVGITIGLVLVFFVFQPYFEKNPIDFPFSDGILVATVGGTFVRAGLLLFATFVAGSFPAWLIVKKNTLDCILGR